MSFENIVGQGRIKGLLLDLLQNNRIPHAVLIEGLKGVGKKRIAVELAKGICCSAKETRPCYVCSSCIKAIHSNHPEIKIIDEDSSIKIETIREIQKEIQLKPYEGTKKVFIINNAERMTIQAQNALLKTLEEPPRYATIILLTHNASSLLPTIISRCQLFKMVPAKVEEIQRYLEESENLSLEESKVIAAFSNGIIGKALRILQDEDFRKKRDIIIEIIKQLLEDKIIDLLEKVSFLNEEKDAAEDIFDIFLSWYRDLLIFRETQQVDFIMNYDKIEEIRQQSKRISSNKSREIILIIEKNKSNMKSNVNHQLNLEVMLLNIQEVLAW